MNITANEVRKISNNACRNSHWTTPFKSSYTHTTGYLHL